jgi:hypothetical protein
VVVNDDAQGNAASIALSSLSLDRTSTTNWVWAKATVTLDQAVIGKKVAVAITTSDPTLILVPAHIDVLPGTASTTFDVRVKSVLVPTDVTVTASYAGVTKTVTLTVKPR